MDITSKILKKCIYNNNNFHTVEYSGEVTIFSNENFRFLQFKRDDAHWRIDKMNE